MLALHYVVPAEKKFWSHAALIFAVLYAPFVVANYIVQLATVIPMVSNGMGDQIELLKQTPHSLIWDFDAIGYIFMGLATFVAIPIFEKKGGHQPDFCQKLPKPNTSNGMGQPSAPNCVLLLRCHCAQKKRGTACPITFAPTCTSTSTTTSVLSKK